MEMKNEQLIKILKSINVKNATIIDDYHSYDIANVLEELNDDNLTIKLSVVLGPTKFSDIFVYFSDNYINNLLDLLGVSYVAIMLSKMEIDDSCQILSIIDDYEKYLPFIPATIVTKITGILSYEDNEIGSIMNPNFIEIDSNLDAKHATKELMNKASKVDFINTLVVTNNHKYIGLINLKNLITADANQEIMSLVNTSVSAILAKTDKEEAAKELQNYNVEALPIVDEENNVLGIITYDDVLDIKVDAAVEDYAAFAGVITDKIEHESESIFGGFKKRILWLIILLFTNLLTASILGKYQMKFDDELVAILSIFLPLMLGMAGNTGTQSLAVTISLLGTNKIDKIKEKIKHLFKEFKIGICNGLIIGIAMLFVSTLILFINRGIINQEVLMIAGSTAISTFIVIIAANLAGVIIPLIMIPIKVDPAAASGPFITTINDILALVIYFSLSALILM